MTRPAPEPPDPPRRWTWLDLRLVPLAATVWVTALVAPRVPVPLLGGAAVAAVAAAVFVARSSVAGAAILVAVLAGLALSAGAGAVRGAERSASPLRAVVVERRTVVVDLELDGSPRVLAGARTARIVVPATVTRLDGAGEARRLNDGVVLFAPADRWSELTAGQSVRARVGTAPPRAGDGTVAVLSARGPPVLLGSPGLLHRAAGGLRAWLADAAGRTLDGRAGGLLPGLVLGDTSRLDPVLEAEFRRAGLSHLTAVSGDNVC
jgi:competence protein ComEC